MELDYTIYFLFTLHILLFVVKCWALYFFTKLLLLVEAPTSEKYMLVFQPIEGAIVFFTAIIVLFEMYFIIYFFEDIELYMYEFASVIDQIFFTILAVTYLKKEAGNG